MSPSLRADRTHPLRGTLGTSPSRERRTVMWGIAVVAAALFAQFAVAPLARRAIERESALAAARAELRSLQSLAGYEGTLDAGANEAEAEIASHNRRVIRARSVTLAASALQAWIQDAANASRMLVTRLDVAPDATDFSQGANGRGESAASTATGSASGTLGDASSANRAADPLRNDGRADAASGMIEVPATLAAYTDIEGLATLLDQLARGARVVRVERMTVQINPALRGADDVLQVTLSLRAPVFLSVDGASP